MLVGLLFYIPEHNETQIGNSEFSAPSGGETLVVVIVIVVIVVHRKGPTIDIASYSRIAGPHRIVL